MICRVILSFCIKLNRLNEIKDLFLLRYIGWYYLHNTFLVRRSYYCCPEWFANDLKRSSYPKKLFIFIESGIFKKHALREF